MNAQEKLASKIEACSTPSLQEMATTLNADLSDEASIVLDAVMGALMDRMPDAEFVGFCRKLEGE